MPFVNKHVYMKELHHYPTEFLEKLQKNNFMFERYGSYDQDL